MITLKTCKDVCSLSIKPRQECLLQKMRGSSRQSAQVAAACHLHYLVRRSRTPPREYSRDSLRSVCSQLHFANWNKRDHYVCSSNICHFHCFPIFGCPYQFDALFFFFIFFLCDESLWHLCFNVHHL